MLSTYKTSSVESRAQSGSDRLAVGLGYLSLAVGAAELIAPKAICRALGLRGLEPVVRAYGAREVVSGVALLTARDPEPWVWARVAGDLADVATVASGLRSDNRKQDKSALAVIGLLAVTAVDVACAKGLGSGSANRPSEIADYSDRSGYPGGLHSARGAAGNFEAPDDMRIPKSLRPLT